MPHDVALHELVARAGAVTRAVSSVPGLGGISAFSYGYMKRASGADVALGVTAYQLAASTQAAVLSETRGLELVQGFTLGVAKVVGEAVDDMEDVPEYGHELARHAIRGALQVGDAMADEIGQVARGAVIGTLRALAGRQVPLAGALCGAGYGAVQGALEAGQDPKESASQAGESARD